MPERRWLADEMVGRLARYLRMLGEDTEYVRGVTPADLLSRARAEGRIVVSRNHLLAGRIEPLVVLASDQIEGQLRELAAVFPEMSLRPRMTRCTVCNGRIARVLAPPGSGWPTGVPVQRVLDGLEVFECASCHHLFWEGTHTERLAADMSRWFPTGAR